MVKGFHRVFSSNQQRTKIPLGDGSFLEYIQYQDIPHRRGRYLFAMQSQIYSIDSTYESLLNAKPASHLFCLSSDGTVCLNRKSLFRGGTLPGISYFNFGVYNNELLYYFSNLKGTEYRLHFLNQSFDEVINPLSSKFRENLNAHDLVFRKNKNVFLLFHVLDQKNNRVDEEIDEVDANENTVFKLNLRQILKQQLRSHNLRADNPFHLNSIALGANGDLVLGLNRTSEVINVGYHSGKLIWEINSQNWSFLQDSYNGFKRQHSVKVLENGNLLMFDNGDGVNNRTSRAVEYKIDPLKKEARFVWEYRSKNPIGFRASGGSVQRLSNGNTLIGWGEPDNLSASSVKKDILFSEVTPAGEVARELYTEGNLMAAFRISFQEE